MGIYDGPANIQYTNSAVSRIPEMMEYIINDDPSLATRTRKVKSGTSRFSDNETIDIYGPIRVRMEPFRQNQTRQAFDERGALMLTQWVMTALDSPSGSYALGDTVRVDEKEYRVVAVYEMGRITEVNLESVK